LAGIFFIFKEDKSSLLWIENVLLMYPILCIPYAVWCVSAGEIDYTSEQWSPIFSRTFLLQPEIVE
jgi:hypothetical protein